MGEMTQKNCGNFRLERWLVFVVGLAPGKCTFTHVWSLWVFGHVSKDSEEVLCSCSSPEAVQYTSHRHTLLDSKMEKKKNKPKSTEVIPVCRSGIFSRRGIDSVLDLWVCLFWVPALPPDLPDGSWQWITVYSSERSRRRAKEERNGGGGGEPGCRQGVCLSQGPGFHFTSPRDVGGKNERLVAESAADDRTWKCVSTCTFCGGAKTSRETEGQGVFKHTAWRAGLKRCFCVWVCGCVCIFVFLQTRTCKVCSI